MEFHSIQSHHSKSHPWQLPVDHVSTKKFVPETRGIFSQRAISAQDIPEAGNAGAREVAYDAAEIIEGHTQAVEAGHLGHLREVIFTSDGQLERAVGRLPSQVRALNLEPTQYPPLLWVVEDPVTNTRVLADDG